MLCLQINLFVGLLVDFPVAMVARDAMVDFTVGQYNDAASGLIWVENQVSLGASETIMGKERFEQWLYDIACVEVKHFHGDNGIFSSEEYRLECSEEKQSQSFLGVGAQHQNSKAEQAIQTIMYMACTFLVHLSLHWTDMGADDISLWLFAVKHAV